MSDPETTTPAGDQKTKRSIWSDAVIVAAIITAGASLAAVKINEQDRAQELNLKYIELGVGILRANPKEENAAEIRGWAVRIVQNFAPIKLTEEEIEQILNKQIKTYNSTYTPSYDSTYTPSYRTVKPAPKPSQN